MIRFTHLLLRRQVVFSPNIYNGATPSLFAHVPFRSFGSSSPLSVTAQAMNKLLADLQQSRMDHQKDKEVLLEQLLTVKDQLLVEKDTMRELIRLQYENKDLERTLLRLQNRYNIRGLLEYIASQHAGHVSGGVQAQLNYIKSQPKFSKLFDTIVARRMLRSKDVERCLANIYYSLSKSFYAPGFGQDSLITIDTTPGGPGTVLSACDGATIEAFLHYHVVPYVTRNESESSKFVQDGGRLVEKTENLM